MSRYQVLAVYDLLRMAVACGNIVCAWFLGVIREEFIYCIRSPLVDVFRIRGTCMTHDLVEATVVKRTKWDIV